MGHKKEVLEKINQKLIVSCQKKLTSAQLKIEKIDLPSLAGTKEADGDEQL